MDFFGQNLSFRFIFYLFLITVLGGCTSTYPPVDPVAKAEPAKVIKIDSEYNLSGGNYWSSRFTTIIYTVVDAKGRAFQVKDFGPLENTRFKPGECVSLWRASTVANAYYPRIAKATSDCQIIMPEPERERYYHYRLDQETLFNRKLDSWLDMPSSRLIANWGEPSLKYNENNQLVLRYREEYKTVAQNPSLRFGYGMTVENDYSCDIKFYVGENNVISGYTWQGNHCY